MKRTSPSIQLFAAAASIDTVAAATAASSMSSRPNIRSGQSQGRRFFSERPSGAGTHQNLVSGDSHFQTVRETNLDFQPSFDARTLPQRRPFNPRPPPQQNSNYRLRYNPNFNNSEQFRPIRPTQGRQFDHNQQFHQPQLGHEGAYFYQDNQFRPHRWQQHVRPLDYREWESAETKPPPDCECFKVLSYNILADYLAVDHRTKLYFHIPRHILDWQWRKKRIMIELGLWSADILCFQEVDRFEDLHAELKLRGYSGIWKMRTGDPIDGCAIFWLASRFKLVQEESIEFNKFGLRDNVAQICVFESLNQNKGTCSTDSPTSKSHANRVVICNIHVLFNPKRGEIKLGQIRVLLDRAYAVSKLWNHAPVVICGDFNSTPKSPIYNFIQQQKLDLSNLPRDKLSGQASADSGRENPVNTKSRPFNNYRGQTDGDSTKFPDVTPGRKAVDAQKLDLQENDLSNEPCKMNLSEPLCSVVSERVETCISYTNSNESYAKLPGETRDDVITEGTHCVPLSSLEENISSDVSSTELFHSDLTSESVEFSSLERSEKILSSLAANFEGSTSKNGCNVISESTGIDVLLDEKMENLHLQEDFGGTNKVENLGEDCETFLSELHDISGSSATAFDESGRYGSEELESGTCSKEFTSSENQGLQYLGDNNANDDPPLNPNTINVEKFYDPSAWTPMEIETATGSADCTVMEHPLKLRSVYGEVKDRSGTRDSTGEPLVTSYHRRFLGTVDYIWRSDGLQTVKVLAPIPKHAMQWTHGFPTKKWGSDHIALVSELAFTRKIPPEREVQ